MIDRLLLGSAGIGLLAIAVVWQLAAWFGFWEILAFFGLRTYAKHERIRDRQIDRALALGEAALAQLAKEHVIASEARQKAADLETPFSTEDPELAKAWAERRVRTWTANGRGGFEMLGPQP